MGSSQSVTTVQVGYEDVQLSKTNKNIHLVNTLPVNDQHCLIDGTVPISKEETLMNSLLATKQTTTCTIILYGKNSADETVLKKHAQMIKLGFKNVYIFGGGLFEWLLLQDIYGSDVFVTNGTERDLIKWRIVGKL